MSIYTEAGLSLLTNFANFDFLLAALFLCKMPFAATLSKILVASLNFTTATSKSVASRTALIANFVAFLNCLLYNLNLRDCLILFNADLWCAISTQYQFTIILELQK